MDIRIFLYESSEFVLTFSFGVEVGSCIVELQKNQLESKAEYVHLLFDECRTFMVEVSCYGVHAFFLFKFSFLGVRVRVGDRNGSGCWKIGGGSVTRLNVHYLGKGGNPPWLRGRKGL